MVSRSKKVICLFMAFLCMFTIFSDTLAPKVEAIGPAIALAGGAVLAILSLAGITFASTGAAYESVEAFKAAYPQVAEATDGLQEFITVGSDQRACIQWTATSAVKIMLILRAAKEYFTADNTSITIPDNLGSETTQGIKYTMKTEFDTAYQMYLYSLKYGYNAYDYYQDVESDIALDDVIKLETEVNGVPWNFYVNNYCNSGSDVSFNFKTKRGTSYVAPSYSSGNNTSNEIYTTAPEVWISESELGAVQAVRFGFTRLLIKSAEYLVPYVVVCYSDKTGLLKYKAGYCSKSDDLTKYCPITDEFEPLEKEIEYDNKFNLDITKLEEALNTLTDTVTGIKTDVQEWVDIIGLGVNEDTRDLPLPYAPDIASIKELLRELLEQAKGNELTKDEVLELVNEIVKEKEQTIPDVADPDLPYKPAVPAIPGIGSTWDYVSDFLDDALIWMKLWFSGFLMLPQPVQTSLWALLVITVVLGILKVFLQ